MNDDSKPKTAAELFAPLIERQRSLERQAALSDVLRTPHKVPTVDDWLLVAEWKSCEAAMGGRPFDA